MQGLKHLAEYDAAAQVFTLGKNLGDRSKFDLDHIEFSQNYDHFVRNGHI